MKPSSVFSNSVKAASLSLAMALAACGGTGQDTGASKTFSQTFRGVALDGNIARARVFIDYDNNGTRDPWEPAAFTDNDGYYSYNPLTNTNYCAAGVDESLALFCLVSTRALESAVIRIDGGYDVLTGEPFVGQMSRRQTLTDNASTVDSVVSPLTSLLTDVIDEQDRVRLLQKLGIAAADLDINYLNSDGAGGIDVALFNKALKLHKVVTVLADRVNDAYAEVGATAGTPNDLSASAYRNLSATLLATEGEMTTLLSNAGMLHDVALAVEEQAREIYDRRNLDLPSTEVINAMLSSVSRASNHAANLTGIIDRILDLNDNTINPGNIVGRARAIEAVVIKSLEERGTDIHVDNAIQFLLNESNSDLADALISALSAENADMAQLVNNDFSGDDFNDVADIIAASQLPEGTAPFSLIAGMQLKVSDMDLGWGPNNLKDAEVEGYFHGDASATSGRFDACVKYIDGAATDGTLGEANTRGELVRGHWSLLNAEANQGASFSLLLTIEFLGTTYQAIIKPAGSELIDNLPMLKFRFDNGEEIRTWHSTAGVVPMASLPQTNADCEARLPSRVGLD